MSNARGIIHYLGDFSFISELRKHRRMPNVDDANVVYV